MQVSELGEFELIRVLNQELGIEYPPRPGMLPRPGLYVDLGDDAVVTARRDAALIWTTDTMVAGVHFLPQKSNWRDVGWKALAVNLSDIAAMGGLPHLALITLTLPPEFLVEDARELYRGLNDAAGAYSVLIGGGDIVSAPVFSITVALSGIAGVSATGSPLALTRSAARRGDVVAVTGSLGDSAGGLLVLKDEAGSEGSDRSRDYLVSRHQHPEPRVASGRAALAAGARCGIDISDGLVQDLGHIARASDAGIILDANRIPTSDQVRDVFPSSALGLALGGGEDYELALVAPQSVIDALITAAPAVPVTVIGEVVATGDTFVKVLDERGQEIPLSRLGWDHLLQA